MGLLYWAIMIGPLWSDLATWGGALVKKYVMQHPSDEAGNVISLMSEVAFIARQAEGLKSLSGWKKSHRLPERINDTSVNFVAQISSDEVRSDLDHFYALIKEAFQFKRRDLDASEPADGTGTIMTPYFSYSVSVTLNPADPTEVIWTRSIDGISAPDQINSAAFGQVFDNVFDSLELALPRGVDVGDFIDAVEAAEIPDLKIKHDREATYCELHIKGVKGAVRLTARTLAIVHDGPQATKQLIHSFAAVESLLTTRQLVIGLPTRRASQR